MQIGNSERSSAFLLSSLIVRSSLLQCDSVCIHSSVIGSINNIPRVNRGIPDGTVRQQAASNNRCTYRSPIAKRFWIWTRKVLKQRTPSLSELLRNSYYWPSYDGQKNLAKFAGIITVVPRYSSVWCGRAKPNYNRGRTIHVSLA